MSTNGNLMVRTMLTVTSIDSVASEVSDGSEVAVATNTNISVTTAKAATVTPSSANSPVAAVNVALLETPPDIQNVKRKPPEDCQVLIRWLELVKLI
jgi:hypothetical protein